MAGNDGGIFPASDHLYLYFVSGTADGCGYVVAGTWVGDGNTLALFRDRADAVSWMENLADSLGVGMYILPSAENGA